jgi:hypothetical protein
MTIDEYFTTYSIRDIHCYLEHRPTERDMQCATYISQSVRTLSKEEARLYLDSPEHKPLPGIDLGFRAQCVAKALEFFVQGKRFNVWCNYALYMASGNPTSLKKDIQKARILYFTQMLGLAWFELKK